MPSVSAHALVTGTAPVSTTVTATGANRLAVFWMVFTTSASGTINGFTYNGVTLPLHYDTVTAGLSTQVYFVLGWTTTVPDSATLVADASPLLPTSTPFHVGWATFSGEHQASPLHWAIGGGGSGTTYGVGKATGATLNSYVSSADMAYGVCWLLGNISTNIADAGVTDLDGTVVASSHQAFHGTTPGTNDDNWNLTWHKGDGSGPNYASAAVVLRDVASAPPVSRGTYAWGRQTGNFGAVERLHPWGDVYSRWADPTPISVSMLAASANAEASSSGFSAVGIGLGNDDFPYTWGDDAFGLRGDGTTGNPLVAPFKLASYPNTTDVCAGKGNVFWISGGVLYGLGLNSNGEFGNGTTTSSASVVTMTLPGGATPSKVRAGDGFVVVIDTIGKAWRAGNIGSASTTWTQIGTYSAYKEADAGVNHAILLRSDGTADDWQGGSTIVNLAPGGPILDVSAYGDAIALMAAGDIYTRGGGNANGELGRVSPTSLNSIGTLAGSTPKALSKRGLGSKNLLWIGTDGRIYGCGDSQSGRQIDPFFGSSIFSTSFDALPEAVLSDRLGASFDWVTGTSQLSRGLGIIAGAAPVLARRLFGQIAG